jgi:hypothetical protein
VEQISKKDRLKLNNKKDQKQTINKEQTTKTNNKQRIRTKTNKNPTKKSDFYSEWSRLTAILQAHYELGTTQPYSVIFSSECWLYCWY